MLSPKCWPFLGLNIRRLFMLVFHQGVSSTKVKKRNSAHFNIYKQNPVSVKKNYLIHFLHTTSSKHLQDPIWKSRLWWTFIFISHQTLAQCMCQSSTPIRNMYNLHRILYKISYNSISKPCVEQKEIYSIKYFRNISWDINISIISQNKIYPYFA